jgi:hypothetical protein
MDYQRLKGIFERTNTKPIVGIYYKETEFACLAFALLIEDLGSFEDACSSYCSDVKLYEYISYEYGWENWDIDEQINTEQYEMGRRLRKELFPNAD